MVGSDADHRGVHRNGRPADGAPRTRSLLQLMNTATVNPSTAPPADRNDRPSDPTRATGGVPLAQRAVTGLLVAGPWVALAVAVPLWWGHVIQLRDVVLAVALYLVTGFGVTIGYHRLFSHGGFVPNRMLKVLLAVAGSMAVEGSPISWVAAHRRHHRFSDRPGDPHSPNLHGPGLGGQLRGLLHAHVGWLFHADPTSETRFAADLKADRDLAVVSRLFPALAVLSLVLPFGIGWALSGTLGGALSSLVWAGAVRMAVLHHVTWSINSVCHVFGTRPFRTKDRSTNVALLSLVSMGESWHNLHHAYPVSARHGALPGQRDPSAALIRVFERFGWATEVHWPAPARLATLRMTTAPVH